jgi:hypothetical protein
MAMKTLLDLTFLACMVAALFYQTLDAPWSLIGDHVMISTCQQIHDDIVGGNWRGAIRRLCLGPRDDRFTPIAWVDYWLRYELCGLNERFHNLLKLGDLYLLVLIIYALGKELGDCRETGLLAALLFAVSIPGSHNWWRFGTGGEKPMVILLFLSLYSLRRSEGKAGPWTRNGMFIASILFLFGAYLSKETALQILPVAFVCALHRTCDTRANPFRRYLFAGVVLALCVWSLNRSFSPHASFESALYTWDPHLWLQNAALYAGWSLPATKIFIFIALMIFIARSSTATPRYARPSLWEIAFLFLSVASLGILMPSRLREARYLLSFEASIALFGALQFSWVAETLQRQWALQCTSRLLHHLTLVCVPCFIVALAYYPVPAAACARDVATFACVSFGMGIWATLFICLVYLRNPLVATGRIRTFMLCAVTSFFFTVIATTLTATVFSGVIGAGNIGNYLLAREQGCMQAVQYVGLNAKTGSRVVMNIPDDREYNGQFRHALRNFYGRHDLRVIELREGEDQGIREGDLMLTWSLSWKYPPKVIIARLRNSIAPVKYIETCQVSRDPTIGSWITLPAKEPSWVMRHSWNIYRFTASPDTRALPSSI